MDKDKINIDYYMGAYGPTVIIIINTDELLTKFYNIIESVRERGEINFNELSFIRLQNINIFKLSYQQKPIKKSVLIDKQGNVMWLFDEGTWDNCVGLLGRFLDGLPGHQYLSEEGYDDALIELSFKENLKSNN